MSVSHRQYFLIRLEIIFGDNFRDHILVRQQFPQAIRSLKRSVFIVTSPLGRPIPGNRL